ncbi:MAG: copper homeostasis protein CutC [Planctomyces sp.]|nr:copper homeostasis protein CutC [Planctomyces sp.]
MTPSEVVVASALRTPTIQDILYKYENRLRVTKWVSCRFSPVESGAAMNTSEIDAPDLIPDPPAPEVLVELCVGGVTDVEVAEAFRLQRIELNSALPLGGLTPAAGLVKSARQIFQGEIIAMVRPREGGFCYSESEFRVMVDDASALIDMGADGIAVGFLLPSGELDEAQCDRFRNAVPRTALVLHRAFDVVRDQREAVRKMIELGWDRILTSGGARTAVEGAGRIRELAELAGEQIEILPGSGIRSGNVGDLLTRTGLRQVHASCGTIQSDRSMQANPLLNFSTPGSLDGGAYTTASNHELSALMLAIDTWLKNREIAG